MGQLTPSLAMTAAREKAPTVITEEPEQQLSTSVEVEPESRPESASPTDTEENPTLFQAIGTLDEKPQRDREGNFFVRLSGKRYGLFIPGYRHRAWLKQISNHPDTPLFLRVYPKCLIIPRKDPVVRFELAAWEEENHWDEEPGMFRLRGVWQFVPQVRIPVISVYRNRGAKDPQGKYKASHLPILMRRSDGTAPFRFNPKIPKEELPKRWFIQARFKFIPSRNCWGWVEDLEPPTEKIPSKKKPVKAEPRAKSAKPRSKPQERTKAAVDEKAKEQKV